MIYRVQFYRLVRNRKRNTYEVQNPITVTVSDYGVEQADDYPEAAFRRRPDLRGNVSGYRVYELKQHGNSLIACRFMSGNAHRDCRDFYTPTRNPKPTSTK